MDLLPTETSRNAAPALSGGPRHALNQTCHPRARRGWRIVFTVLLGACTLIAAQAGHAFGFEDVAKQARTLAGSRFKPQDPNLPKELQGLTYDRYRNIRFKPERAYWRGAKLPFELMFFHEGSYYDRPVKINELAPQGVREIRYSPDMFDFGPNKIDPKQLRNLGFAGFRVHYPVNTTKYKDEVLVFLGASYFRAVGRDQIYGLSARALALDTALNSGEEFPRFTEFWIQRPAAGAKDLTIYALLDSSRATGAYRFILRPGTDTVVDVKAQLFLRENVTKLGMAPLTSMFFFGENQASAVADYRPEVHDSDGLSIQSGTGEWIWRPLINPKRLQVSSFALTNPLGFGLMQRDRSFTSYEDLDDHYEKRPSAWVEPKGNWGRGRVELVQIPTPDETNDNIVAYWVPDAPPRPKQPYSFEYRLSWQKDNDKRPSLAWVSQSRRGHGYRGKPDDSLLFAVDFEGPALKKLAADAKVEGNVSLDANGKILELVTQRNEVTGGWRVMMRMRRLDTEKPVEMRAYLRSGSTTLSETWSYLLPPE
ncbi:Glucans biosynthesis protein G [Pandoraea terrae]|uniref:Glucans biosynthesis protein G n=1 Tax=Pandoraea terrae TaxID=1537710 RepID=A0A5E4TST7_9BURK|nr:glucan biosynthesis protein G [Pandoraea terrae]VVD90837.1 Glucans biosynthesis protein G [Pandoraea terrae]